jgi:hypothetical protein
VRQFVVLYRHYKNTLPEVRSGNIGRVKPFREPRIRRIPRQLATVRGAVRNGRVRAKTSGEPPPEVDATALVELLSKAAAQARLVEVPVSIPPWTPIPLRVAAGQQVTWLAWGRVYLSKPLAIAVGPSIGLLCRVDGGRPQHSARDTMTFTADRSGQLHFGARFPGWLQPDGSIATDRIPYRAMAGRLYAVVACWAPGTDPGAVLAALAPHDASGLCAAEAGRIADPPSPPPGWHHHPSTGQEEIYSASEGGILVRCRDSGGIVRHPVDTALTPTLWLRWSWRVDELPSRLPEDTALTHDYLSVALEFDDGQDLTWKWSCALPEGLAYRCPMDYWRRIETHLVVRSGTTRLGEWIQEERPVLTDHQVAIGGPPPARVVNAWLIAVSFHQRGTVLGEFGRIELVDGDRVVSVL